MQTVPELFDTHCHLGMDPLRQNVLEVLARARAKGVRYAINVAIGSSFEEIERQLHEFSGLDDVYMALGVHPHDADVFPLGCLGDVRKLLDQPKVVAIGEVGLDLYYRSDNLAAQKALFAGFLGLAQETGLPVVIHSRDACSETMDILRAFPKGALGGVFHCFSYSLEVAQEALERGFLVSFAGNITFKRSVALREVARDLPLEGLILETDAPFLAPEPFRGKPNEPAYVLETARVLSEVKRISPETVARVTTANAIKLFKIEAVQAEVVRQKSTTPP